MADLNVHVHGLVELGLTRYEAKAYLTLIQRESYAASEFAIEAGIPRQRIYDVLNSLVSRGLARDWPRPGDPVRGHRSGRRDRAIVDRAAAGADRPGSAIGRVGREIARHLGGRPEGDRAAGLRRGAARPRPARRPVPGPATGGRPPSC